MPSLIHLPQKRGHGEEGVIQAGLHRRVVETSSNGVGVGGNKNKKVQYTRRLDPVHRSTSVTALVSRR